MRPHIDAHLAGQLMGDIPSDWLCGQGFSTCEVCQHVLSLRFSGPCPSCFQTLTSRPPRPLLDPWPVGPLASGTCLPPTNGSTSKVAVDLTTDRARETLNGCDAAIHFTRQWFFTATAPIRTRLPSCWTSPTRSTRCTVRCLAGTHFPSIAPWIDDCFRHESTLFTGSGGVTSQVTASARGFQQGDPQVQFFSHSPSTLSSRKHDMLRRRAPRRHRLVLFFPR